MKIENLMGKTALLIPKGYWEKGKDRNFREMKRQKPLSSLRSRCQSSSMSGMMQVQFSTKEKERDWLTALF